MVPHPATRQIQRIQNREGEPASNTFFSNPVKTITGGYSRSRCSEMRLERTGDESFSPGASEYLLSAPQHSLSGSQGIKIRSQLSFQLYRRGFRGLYIFVAGWCGVMTLGHQRISLGGFERKGSSFCHRQVTVSNLRPFKDHP